MIDLNAVGKMLSDVSVATGAPTARPELVPGPDGKTMLAVVRNGYSMTPVHGPMVNRRTHTCTSVRSFGAWLRRHASPRVTEILANNGTIVAALSPRDPDGDVIECVLESHPRAKPWTSIFGKRLDQRALWQFVRSHIDDFEDAVTPKGEVIGSYGRILARELQKLEVKKGGVVKTEIDDSGNILFSAGEEKMEVMGELPAYFNIKIPLLRDVVLGATEEEPLYTLEVFLEMKLERDAGGVDRPVLGFACPGLELAKIHAEEDALECLRETLSKEDDGTFMIGFGAIKMDEVPASL